jgi:hypothetical protein
MKTLKLVMLAFAVCCGILIWLTDLDEPQSSTRTFCVYGKLFVRFKEGNAVWGTMLLDDQGMPIQCRESNIKEGVKGTI